MKQDKKKQIYFSHFSIKNKVYKNHKNMKIKMITLGH